MINYLIILQIFIDIFFIAIIWLLLSEINKLSRELAGIYHIISDWSYKIAQQKVKEEYNDKDYTSDGSGENG